MKKYPNTRMGWHKFFVKRFNKTGRKSSEHMALWFFLLHEAFGESTPPN